jgi:hypothetical protein
MQGSVSVKRIDISLEVMIVVFDCSAPSLD